MLFSDDFYILDDEHRYYCDKAQTSSGVFYYSYAKNLAKGSEEKRPIPTVIVSPSNYGSHNPVQHNSNTTTKIIPKRM